MANILWRHLKSPFPAWLYERMAQGLVKGCIELAVTMWLTLLKLACTTSKGFAIIGENLTLSYICKPLPPEDEPYTRFNDGGCDNKGRFFAGTLWNQDHGITGKLYRYDPATDTCDVVDEGPFTVR